MFSRAPIAGKVKTRLAASLGDEAAAQIQAAFIRDLGNRYAAFRGERLLAATPTSDHPVFAELVELGWRAVEQGAGDLGERLERWVRRLLESGPRRLVIIGSDSPTLPAELVGVPAWGIMVQES